MSGHDDDDNDGVCVVLLHAEPELSGKLVANFIRHEFSFAVYVSLYFLYFSLASLFCSVSHTE